MEDTPKQAVAEIVRSFEANIGQQQRDWEAGEAERQEFLSAYRDVAENIIFPVLAKIAEDDAIKSSSVLKALAGSDSGDPFLTVEVEPESPAFAQYMLKSKGGTLRFTANPARRRVIRVLEIHGKETVETPHEVGDVDDAFVARHALNFLRRILPSAGGWKLSFGKPWTG